jgi:hypothetical protein
MNKVLNVTFRRSDSAFVRSYTGSELQVKSFSNDRAESVGFPDWTDIRIHIVKKRSSRRLSVKQTNLTCLSLPLLL